jgi:hypothetical protein
MWTASRSRADRILAAIELPALGLWLGALCGFAFVFAPVAFRIVAPLDTARFAALTATVLGMLATAGYICGGIAIVAALIRSREAGDRTYDFLRALFVVLALGLVWAQSAFIIPAMAATTDFHSAAYRQLHSQSSTLYGGVLLLGIIAFIMGAARREN